MVSAPTAPELKWGVLTSAEVAGAFTRDIYISPLTRGVSDVAHRLVAVGTASTKETSDFVEKYLSEFDDRPREYGTHQGVICDPDIQIVYIATLYRDHFQDAMACLHAGKHVLMDKPCTVNSAQVEAMTELAKAKGLFLMEGMWTQFLPIADEVRRIIDNRLLGTIKHVSSSFMFDIGEEDSVTERFHSYEVAGGSLLDLGPYPWTWISLTACRSLFGPPSSWPSTPILPSVTSSAAFTPTGVDESISALLKFSSTSKANGHAPSVSSISASFQTSIAMHQPSETPCCVVHGSKGNLSLGFHTSRPTRLILETFEPSRVAGMAPVAKEGLKRTVLDFEIPGGARGYGYEMDAVARCIKEGKSECDVVPWKATLLSMGIFDKIRKQNGLVFSDEAESAIYIF